MSNRLRDEIICRIQQGETATQISNEMGVDKRMIYNIAQRARISITKGTIIDKTPHFDRSDLQQMVDAGYPREAICDILGCSDRTLKSTLTRLGIEVPLTSLQQDREHTREEVLKILRTGCSAQKCAKMIGCSEKLVKVVRKENGINLRERANNAKKAASDTIILELIRKGLCVNEICKELGCSNFVVRACAERHNIKVSPQKRSMREYDMALLDELILSGERVRDISIKIGCSNSYVSRRKKEILE